MALTRWNPFDEDIFFGNEMDPIYEDNLARILNQWSEDQAPAEDLEFKVDQQQIGGRIFITHSRVDA